MTPFPWTGGLLQVLAQHASVGASQAYLSDAVCSPEPSRLTAGSPTAISERGQRNASLERDPRDAVHLLSRARWLDQRGVLTDTRNSSRVSAPPGVVAVTTTRWLSTSAALVSACSVKFAELSPLWILRSASTT